MAVSENLGGTSRMWLSSKHVADSTFLSAYALVECRAGACAYPPLAPLTMNLLLGWGQHYRDPSTTGN